MQNLLAIYTVKSAMNGRTLTKIALAAGVRLRFTALGGMIVEKDRFQSKALSDPGGLLVVGAFESDSDSLTEFDALVDAGDRAPIAALLNCGKLPWCELYVRRFNYNSPARKPRDKAMIDGSVAKKDLAAVKAAKTRYVVHNHSRRKNGRELMQTLAEAIATSTGGVISDHQHPGR